MELASRREPGCPDLPPRFERAVQEVFWSKFVLREGALATNTSGPVEKSKPRRTPKSSGKAWNVLQSFWKARDCDSDGLYDTVECYHAMIALDWKRALQDGRLERLIVRVEKRSGGDGDDSDEGGELEDCEEVLREHAELVYSVYDEYCLHGGNDDSNDIFSIEKVGFSALLNDFKIDVPKSKTCRLADLDTLFLEVNAASARAAKEMAKGGASSVKGLTQAQKQAMERMNDTGLSRPEWLQVLVGIAVKRVG